MDCSIRWRADQRADHRLLSMNLSSSSSSVAVESDLNDEAVVVEAVVDAAAAVVDDVGGGGDDEADDFDDVDGGCYHQHLLLLRCDTCYYESQCPCLVHSKSENDGSCDVAVVVAS